MVDMKTLTIGDTTFEVIDDQARSDIAIHESRINSIVADTTTISNQQMKSQTITFTWTSSSGYQTFTTPLTISTGSSPKLVNIGLLDPVTESYYFFNESMDDVDGNFCYFARTYSDSIQIEEISMVGIAEQGETYTIIVYWVEESDSLSIPELTDIRVGFDGTTYATAGNAVRGQVSDLKSDLNAVVNGNKTLTPILGDYDGTNKIVASTTRAYVYCELGNIATISIASGFQFSPKVNDNGIGSSFAVIRAWSANDYDISANTHNYLLCMVRKEDDSTMTQDELADILTFELKNSISKVRDDLTANQETTEKIQNLIGYEWLEGYYIYADGSVTTSSDRACTKFIPCSPQTTITYIGENNNANVCGIAFYDGTFKFISGDKNSGTIGDSTTVTSPTNASYLRVSTKISILEDSGFSYDGERDSALLAVAKKALRYPVYVDSVNGNDTTGDGRASLPYKTIQHAIDLGAEKIGIIVASSAVYQEEINVDGGEIHLFAAKTSWNSSVPNRIRAKIDGDSSVTTALTIQNAKNVILEDIEVYGCTGDGCLIENCGNVLLINCAFHDNGTNGIVLNYTNGVVRKSGAYSNGNDGFNINYYGNVDFYDCYGYSNGDDGISHHQGCTGIINGGEWYSNVKGGIASPANGAQVDIFNVYCHDNGYGIWANADTGTEARTFYVWNSVLVNNSYYGLTSLRNTALVYNCKISGNTSGQTSGNVTVLD